MSHIRCALECMFANPTVVGYKPTKHFQNKSLPTLIPNHSKDGFLPPVCAKTGLVLPMNASIYCPSCCRYFSSSEYINEFSTIIQCTIEDAVKVCLDCKLAQCCVLWLKNLTYVHIMNLHELTPMVNIEVVKFKASFKLRRKTSRGLDMAAQLLDQENINLGEFEELRRVDHEFRREQITIEGDRIAKTLDYLGSDMQTMISLLLSSNASDACGRLSYYQVILKIITLADTEIELIDFYFPQLIHIHFVEAKYCTVSSMFKVDLLQQALLAVSAKYPGLSLKLAWSLMSMIGDYFEKRVCTSQYAAAMVLLLELEMIMSGQSSALLPIEKQQLLIEEQEIALYGMSNGTGTSNNTTNTITSGSNSKHRISNIPTSNSTANVELHTNTNEIQICKQLIAIFKPCSHQKEALLFDINVLFRVRYRLYEVEAKARYKRDQLYGLNNGVFSVITGMNPLIPGSAGVLSSPLIEDRNSSNSNHSSVKNMNSNSPNTSASNSSKDGKELSPKDKKNGDKWYPGKYIAKLSNSSSSKSSSNNSSGSRGASTASTSAAVDKLTNSIPALTVSNKTNMNNAGVSSTTATNGSSEPASTLEPNTNTNINTNAITAVNAVVTSITNTNTNEDSRVNTTSIDTSDGSSDGRDSGFGIIPSDYALAICANRNSQNVSDTTGTSNSSGTKHTLHISSIVTDTTTTSDARDRSTSDMGLNNPSTCLSYLLSIGSYYEEIERKRLEQFNNTGVDTPPVSPTPSQSGSCVDLTKVDKVEEGDNALSPPITSPNSPNPNTSELQKFYGLNATPTVSTPGQSTVSNKRLPQLPYRIWSGFGNQLDFIHIITELVERLRFIERPLRTDKLRGELEVLCSGLLGGILIIVLFNIVLIMFM